MTASSGYLAVSVLTVSVVSMLIFAYKKANDINKADMDAMDEAEHGPFTEDDAIREIPPTPSVAEVVFEG